MKKNRLGGELEQLQLRVLKAVLDRVAQQMTASLRPPRSRRGTKVKRS